MGGVETDLDGRASVEGLWAVGEVASTGVHGANRLASNSLLEAIVFGKRIADELRDAEIEIPDGAGAPADRMELASRPANAAVMAQLREAMSEHCALIRNADGLADLIDFIRELNDHPDMTSGLKSAVVTAEIIAQGALMREESRGGHFREDFPDTDAEAFHTEVRALIFEEEHEFVADNDA